MLTIIRDMKRTNLYSLMKIALLEIFHHCGRPSRTGCDNTSPHHTLSTVAPKYHILSRHPQISSFVTPKCLLSSLY